MNKSKKPDQRREQIREQRWPEAGDRIWKGTQEKGWWPAPRVLPLLLHLTKDKKIVGNKDCSRVYLELLSRDFGQGLVEIRDEDEHAFCAGYTGNRARRSWQERMRLLAKNGFIEIAAKGNRAIGYVLIVHPARVATKLRGERKVTEQWWEMLQQQLIDSGAGALDDPLSLPELRVIEGGVGEAAEPRARRRR
jgi:hypothetical protein